MTKKKSERPLPRVQWNQEKRVFTLEKVPVLELSLLAAGDGREPGRGTDQPVLPAAGRGLAEPLGAGDLLAGLLGPGAMPGGIQAFPALERPTGGGGALAG